MKKTIALLLTVTAWAGVAYAGGAHRDHAPRHGGVLMMKGDLHYEVATDFEGRFAIYFSDAHRRPLAHASVSRAAITLMRDDEERETIILRPDEGGAWTGTGPKIEGSEVLVRVSFAMRGEDRPYRIDLALERGPSAAVHASHHHH